MRAFLIALCCITLVSHGVFGSTGQSAMEFVKLGSSVKAVAIGNAYTAGLDSRAVLLNPSAISEQSFIECGIQHMTYVEQTTYQSVKAFFPTEMGNIGVVLGHMDYGTQVRTTLTNRSGSGVTFSNSGLSTAFVYANSIDDLGIGVAIKYVSETLDSRKSSLIALDLGSTYYVSDSLRLGVSIIDLSITKATFVSESAGLDTSARFGGLYTMKAFSHKLHVSSDLIYSGNDGLNYAVGLDYVIHPNFSVRTGYNSMSDLGKLSLGAGLNLGDFDLDVSYKPMLYFGETYRLGLSFGFK